MHVLHVTDTFLPKVGGAEIAIDQLLRAMTALGVDITVLAQIDQGHTQNRNRNALPAPPLPNPQSSQVGRLVDRQHIARLEREPAPSTSSSATTPSPPATPASSTPAAPADPPSSTPAAETSTRSPASEKNPTPGNASPGHSPHATTVICASAAMEAIVREIIGTQPADGRLIRIPNGVNIEDLRADASTSRFAKDPRFSQPFILALGRTIRRKGFHLLIDAYAHLPTSPPPHLPTTLFPRLVIAGEGKELDNLKAQAAPLGDRVLFTGLVQTPTNASSSRTASSWPPQASKNPSETSPSKPWPAVNPSSPPTPVASPKSSRPPQRPPDPTNNIQALTTALNDYLTRDLTSQSLQATKTAQSFSWPTIAKRYINLIHQVLATA